MSVDPARTVAYGPHRDQVADLHRPAAATRRHSPVPVVTLVHGGFWRPEYDRTLMAALARDLSGRGIAACNIEYRRFAEPGASWPALFDDVALAVDTLATIATEEELDLDRVIAVGHSAGGHLALWLAARPRLPSGAPGAQPAVRVRAAVSQAGVADLVSAYDEALGRGAVGALVGGGPGEVADRYAMVNPAALVPLGVVQLLVHGDEDTDVPVQQSRDYAALAAGAGDEIELVELAGCGHDEHLDPGSDAWRAVVDRLPALLG